MKMEELNRASLTSKKILASFKEEIPSEEVQESQKKLQYREATNLLKKGFAKPIIAEKLNLPIGEVELINKLNSSAFQKTSRPLTV